MYISNARASDAAQATPRPGDRGRIATRMDALGAVSLITNVSYNSAHDDPEHRRGDGGSDVSGATRRRALLQIADIPIPAVGGPPCPGDGRDRQIHHEEWPVTEWARRQTSEIIPLMSSGVRG